MTLHQTWWEGAVMRMRTFASGVALTILVVATPAWAQHEGHTAPGSQPSGVNQQQLAACVQSQQQVMSIVDAANRRLETARQTNDPTALRNAVDDFQATLSLVKRQLAACVEVAAAGTPGDPHAGHVMPSAQSPSATPGAAAMSPGSTTPAPSAAAKPGQQVDPHAGHTMPGSQAQTQPSGASGGNPSGLAITVGTMPTPPRAAAENQFEVTVKDRQGKPVDGADVTVMMYMPAMPAMKMPEMRNEIHLKGIGGGRYTGTGQVMMAGSWTLTATVRQNGKEIGQYKTTVTAK